MTSSCTHRSNASSPPSNLEGSFVCSAAGRPRLPCWVNVDSTWLATCSTWCSSAPDRDSRGGRVGLDQIGLGPGRVGSGRVGPDRVGDAELVLSVCFECMPPSLLHLPDLVILMFSRLSTTRCMYTHRLTLKPHQERANNNTCTMVAGMGRWLSGRPRTFFRAGVSLNNHRQRRGAQC